MFFSLCSSAGVQGVFVRLFLAGGPMAEDAILGSSVPMEAGAAPDGPDIGRDDVAGPDARLLFRAPVGDKVSGLTEVSAVVGRTCEGEIPDAGSSSVLSTRLDIGSNERGDALVTDIIEVCEIQKAGQRGSSLVHASRKDPQTRVRIG